MGSRLITVGLLFSSWLVAQGNWKQIPAKNLMNQMEQRSSLIASGSKPFHMKATIAETKDPNSQYNGQVEEYWVSPTKYRRTITTRDFSQTKIVNGDQVYEENKGDYLPYVDEELADTIVDPLPPEVIELFDKLGIQATAPGQRGPGQCMAEQYFKDDAGQETRALLAYQCDTGLLIYVWSPTCCYGVMGEYKKFHGKMVAYATKDNPINIKIDKLEELDRPDETLFAVTNATEPANRLAFEHMSETMARKLIVRQKEIAWPKVTKAPQGPDMTVDVVIGRDGKVKESKTYAPVENAIEDAVLNSLSEWQFQPETVNGVPAEVATELRIPFPAEVKAAGAELPSVAPVFDRMRAMSDYRVEGAAPFHMKASFHTEDGEKGSYEETWISPKKWRREVTTQYGKLVEVRAEEAFYRKFSGGRAPRIADDVADAIAWALPGDDGVDFQKADWRMEEKAFGNLAAVQVTSGYVNSQGRPDPQTREYMMAKDTGALRGRMHYEMLTVFNDLQPWGDKTVARKLTVMRTLATKLEIEVESMEQANNVGADVFDMHGEKPLYTYEEGDATFTQARLVTSTKLRVPGFHGDAMCVLFVDEHGHVRDAEVSGVSDANVAKQIRIQVMQWEYQPGTYGGRPRSGPVRVKLE